MKQMRLGELANAALAEAEVQGEIESQIKDLVRRDSIFTRKERSHSVGNSSESDAKHMVKRISAVSLEVIDQAISRLQHMKASLLDQNEKVRLQVRALELANEEACGSLKTVSDVLAQWKQSSPVASPSVAAE
jgi:hypothetical protein